PSAGPPAFLDDDLIGFNDVDNSPANPFPDHTVFVEYLRSHGRSNALLMVPGSTLRVANGEAIVRHPSEDALKVYEDKRSYLKAYAQRVRSRIAMERASWPAPGIDILGELKRRMEPLLRMA